jgi:hypothetical protein
MHRIDAPGHGMCEQEQKGLPFWRTEAKDFGLFYMPAVPASRFKK